MIFFASLILILFINTSNNQIKSNSCTTANRASDIIEERSSSEDLNKDDKKKRYFKYCILCFRCLWPFSKTKEIKKLKPPNSKKVVMEMEKFIEKRDGDKSDDPLDN